MTTATHEADARELLDELAHLGVRLSAEGDQLNVRAPRGVLSAELRGRLAERKPWLLELLRQAPGAAPAAVQAELVPSPSTRYEPFPLTDIQQAYWVGRTGSMELGSVGCHAYWEIDAVAVDVARLERAWQRLVERHDALRLVFLPSGEQRAIEHVPLFSIEVLDLRGRSSASAGAELGALRERMSHRVYASDEWPLFDLRAARVDERVTRLFFSFDLLVLDAASILQFLSELRRLYAEPEAELPRLELTFRDYVLAERKLQAGADYERAQAYWRERAATLAAAPELPQVPPSAGRAPRFVRRMEQMEPDLWARLKARAQRAGLTPSGVLCAAFAEVLAAWSASSRFTLTLTQFRRLPLHRQVHQILGDFTSTILLEFDPPPGSFESRARCLQQRLAQDLDHSQVSGVRVMRDRNRLLGGEAGGFPVVFTSTLGHRGSSDAEGSPVAWLGEPIYAVSQTPQVSLDLQASDYGVGLQLVLDAPEALFPPGFLDELFEAYRLFVRRLGEDESAWQASPGRSLTRPAAALALQARANATDAAVAHELLHEPFLARAAQDPAAVAVVCPTRRLSYGELARASRRLGLRLRQAGARPNTLVAVVMEKGWEQVAAVLGVLQSGAAYLPIEPTVPAERLRDLLEHAQVEWVLTQPGLDAGLAWPAHVQRLLVDEQVLEGDEVEAPERAQTPDDLAYLIYTSGSTGTPKGVMIDHRAALNTILDVNRRFGVTPADRVLALSSLSFDLSVYDIFGLLAAGGTVVLPDPARRHDAAHWSELVSAEGVTLWNTVPTLMELWVEAREKAPPAPMSLRLVLMSGDWIPVTLPERIRALAARGARPDTAAPAPRVISLGGATEASIWSILYPIERVDPRWKSIPYGRGMANQRFHVLGDDLEERPVWVPGTLYIGGIGLARGYWRDDEKTRASFIVHPHTGERLYRTGDLGRWLPDGNIEFLGRQDGQVKVGGHRIELGEIEAALLRHPSVQQAVVLVRQETGGGKRLAGFVVPAAGVALAGLDETLRAHLFTKLPDYMVPSTLLPVAALPVTANAKVDRRRLLELASAAGRSTPARDQAGPDTDTERALVTLAAEVFGHASVGTHDNLFEHGCTSIDLVRLVNRVREMWGRDVSLAELFRQPTLAALGARLDGRPAPALALPAAPPALPAATAAPDHGPASASQEQLWFTERLRPGSSTYHVHAGLRLRGRLDVDALGAALNDVVRRHQALRMSFREVDGRPLWSALPVEQVPALPVVRVPDLAGEAREQEARRRAQAHARVPFELRGDVLFRAELVVFAPDDALLLVTQHHLVTDGWSVGVFGRDLLDAYSARAAGRAPAWPPLPLEYGTLIERQHAWLQGESAQRERAWWQARLAGLSPLELPIRRSLAGLPSERGDSRAFRLSGAFTDELRALALRERTTLFTVLLAAYAALLHRYSGGTDFGIGTVTANRAAAERADVVGYLANTLVLRCDLRGDPSFSEWLERAGQVAVEALEHEELPFFELTRLAGAERSRGLNPLVEACFAFENVPLPSLERPGLVCQPVLETPDAGVVGSAKFDLALIVAPASDGLVGDVQFATDLFDGDVIERLIGHYRALLAGALRDPRTRLSRLPVMDAAERRQVLVGWNAAPRARARAGSVVELVERQARVRPDAPAVEARDGTLSYGELDARSARWAERLRAGGLAAEATVAILLERSALEIVALLAALKAGAAYVPLDPAFPAERLAFMIEDAGARIVLTDSALAAMLPPLGVPVLALDREAHTGARLPTAAARAAIEPEQSAYVIYTSGSTGRPKGVVVEHGNLLQLVEWDQRTFPAAPGERRSRLIGSAFDASVWEIWPALAAGACLVVADDETRSSPPRLRDWLVEQRVSVSTLPTVLGRQLMEMDWTEASALRVVRVGGEQLDRHPSASLPWALINNYGPTENTVQALSAVVPPLSGATQPPSIGRPLDYVQTYILDAACEPVPVGVPGELFLGGTGVARGYLGRPDLTAERFLPDPFGGQPGARLYRTGDVGRWRPAGEVEFLGRLDQQVKIRGFRIELGEIEAVLGAHPELFASAVVVREDVPGDKRLAAYVVPRDGQSLSTAELRDFLARRLPASMLPSAFVVLGALPLTPNGKVDRRALPAPEAQAGEDTRGQAPRTPMEEILAAIWADVLNLRQVGIHQDFFALGGHSLLATQVASRLRRTLGMEVPLRTLFEAPSVAALARHLETQQPARALAPPIERVARTEAPELSFAQQRLWFLDQLQPGSALYNIPCPLRLDGPLDVDVLQRALDEIVRRHEALRTVFAAADAEARQVVAAPGRVALERVDLESLDPGLRAAEAQRLVDEEARRPFDLERGPLLRVLLLRLDGESHVLLLNMHHIVSDGWSIGVLARELTTLYEAFRAGRPSPLPELEVQYADYAHWQRQWLAGEALETQLSYWKERLGGGLAPLELPADRVRPALQSDRGAVQPLTLSRATTDAAKALAQREGATLFMVLLAVFKTLLLRYTGQADLVVGTPIAGRNRAELEGLIGFFVNTLPLRTDMSGDPTFRELLSRVREGTLQAYAHQDVPFEWLVEALQPQRDPSRTPLFQVMFALQNTPLDDLRIEGLSLRPLPVDTGTSKFDLTLLLGESAEGLTGVIESSTDLFERERIARLAGHLQVLLAAAVAQPDAPLSRLPLLTEAERRQALVEWNDTQVPFDTRRCTHELFEEHARRRPDAPAVTCGDSRLSYAELNARANRLARELRVRGVTRETPVGVCLERSIELLVAFLGVLKAGGTYVPLDPAYPPERLAYMLADTQAPVLLTHSHLLAQMPPTDAQQLVLDRGWRGPLATDAADLATEIDPAQIAYVIYTSGSTGRPKGAMVEQRGMLNHLQVKIAELGLTSADVLAETAPQCFDISIWQFLAALLVGGSVHILDDAVVRDPLLLLDATEARGITVLEVVPSMLRLLLDEAARRGEERPQFGRLRWMVATGEELPVDLARRWLAQYPRVPLLNAYGPTECSDDVTHHALDRPPEASAARVPIGRALGNMQLYVLDRGFEPLPVGVPGELYVGGAGVGRGYLGNPARTADVFLPDPFSGRPGARLYKTGDLARRLPDGSLDFLGRVDFQIKVRGHRIELGEIESALGAHPALGASVVVAREDVPGDKRLVAYVVPRQGDTLSAADLRAFLKQRVPEYMLPSAFVVLEALPLTPNGKLDRRALPAPDARAGDEARGEAPRSPLEEILASVWAEVLGKERVGIHQNFFDLGGHSLLATQVVSRIRRTLGLEVPLRLLFEAPSVAALAERLEAQQPARALVPPVERVARTHAPELSFAQQRLWFLDQLQPGSALYNIPCPIRLEGPLDVAALEQALAEIVRRHEALRTTILSVGGQARQAIAEPADLPLELVDLQAHDEAARETEAQRLIEEDARRPFDLERGPLLRARLLRLGALSHVLLLNLHHIVSDGWSIGVLARELTVLYEAFRAGRPSPLPELEVQYADFAQWQRQWLAGEALDAQLAYWRERLGGGVPTLELPADRPRRALESHRGALERFTLSRGTVEALEALARREGATLFMVLLAAFQTLLSRYTGQDDVVVGTPIAGRNRAETEGLIGFFINTLALRTDLSGDPSFRELLARVREVTLGAYAHQDAPFEWLVETLQPQRDLSRTPLFQVVFALQNAPFGELQLEGLQLHPLPVDTGTAKFDLTLNMGTGAEGAWGVLEYSTDLFERERIARLAAHLCTLLEGIAARPEARLSSLPLLTHAEERQVVALWNDARVAPVRGCLHTLFEAQAARTPDATALVHEGEALTYAELNRRANQLAHHLRGKGVGPDQLVGLYVERSAEMVVALLGILKAGAAYLPLDPAYPRERLAFMLDDADARVVLTEESLLAALPAGRAEVLCLDRDAAPIAAEAEHDPAPVNVPEHLAYVIYTSGSTGTPKGVMVTHANVARLFSATEAWFHFDAQDVWSFFHSHAFDFSVWELWGALLYGGRVVVVPYWVSRSPEAFYELLVNEGVTVLSQTPSAFRQLGQVEEARGVDERLKLREVIFGGEALELGGLRGWWARHGDQRPRLVNMYGITETTVHVTYKPLRAEDGAHTASLVGRGIPDLQVYVLDRHLNLAPLGVPGELCIGGAGLARGYLRRPALTAERFVPDPFGTAGGRLYRSGDLGRWRADGTLEYLGRIDHQVKVRGFRIELGEIEAALGAHPEVGASVVMVREDAPGDKRLVAYVVPRAGQAPVASELRRFLGESLPEYMLPAACVLLEALPLTPHGKIDRRALPAPEGERPDLAASYVAPRTDVERTLAAVWAAVLGVERVGVHDNFFDLGGDSILSIQVRARARERGLDFSLQQLFQHPTVERLAGALSVSAAMPAEAPRRAPFSLVSEADRTRLPAGLEDAYPLSLLQAGMLFHGDYDQDTPLYHNVGAYHLRAPLDVPRLETAVRELVRRHPVLRTSFELSAFSEPLQLVHRDVDVALEVHDVSHLTASEQERALAAWIEAEKARRFDPALPGLARFGVRRRSADAFDFTLVEHHAILDGWSVAALLTELFQCYSAALAGQSCGASAPLTTFGDFVELERQILSSAEAEAYWRRRLLDVTVARLPRLGNGNPGPARAASLDVPLPRGVSPGLKDLARTAGVPVKSVLLAAHLRVAALLRGHGDVLTGLVSNGRPEEAGAERVLGLFLNTLPLRLELAGGTWRQLVEQVVAAEQELLPFRRYPLARLQQQTGGQALFDTVFNFTHFHVYKALEQIEGLEALEGAGYGATNFTLVADFSLDLSTGDVQLRLEYNAAALGAEQVQAIAAYYQRALAAMAARPESRYEQAELLPDDERRRVLVAWNATAAEGAAQGTLHELFEARVERAPEATALVFADGSWSYAELNRRANRLARRLRALGVGPDVRVGLRARRRPEMLAGILAVLKAGGAYVPIDPDYPRERQLFMLQDSGASVWLAEPGGLEDLALAGLPRLDPADACAPEDASNLARFAGPRSLAYVIYTSGSTGRPKGVGIEHSGAVNLARDAGRRFGLGAGDVMLQFASLGFDASVWEWTTALTSGAALLLPRQEEILDVEAFMHLAGSRGVGVALLPPPYLAQVDPERLAGLRTLLVGGEACPVALARRWADGRQLFNAYGPTEASVYVTLHHCDGPPVDALPIGRPIGNVRAYVLDVHGQPLPVGVPGELYAGGAGLARGYLGHADLTAERFVPDPFGEAGARLYRTGDLARHRPDGSLEFLGRIDHQVKVRGFRIELGEIEAALCEHADVAAAAVLVREDVPGDKRLVAYVVPHADHAPSAAELRDGLARRLPEYMLPATFVLLKSLPLTPNGKVDRRALPAPDVQAGIDTASDLPRTPLEEILASLWAEVLHLERVGRHQDFFALGGHSLLATQLISRLRRTLGMEVPLRALFDAPSVAALARDLEARRSGQAPAPPIVPVARTQALELSFAQQRLWFLDRLQPGSALYNIPCPLRLDGALDVAALERALHEIVRRHEALRTTFVSADGQARQVVAEPVPVRLERVDLESCEASVREAEVRRLAEQEARRPFDLARGPLLRAQLLRLGAESHVLLLTMHHIVSDGWSVGVLARELTALYTAFQAQRPSPLPELEVQYADFAHWQRQWLAGEALETQLTFWRERLGDAAPALDLPADRPRPAVQSGRGASVPFRLSRAAVEALTALARREGATLFMVLLAAFKALLLRYTGATDLVVGTPIAGRNRAEIEGLIGFFVNTLPLRTDLSGDPSFRELVGRVREVTLQAYAHQDVPFEWLVETLHVQRDPGRTPLFQVMFALQNTPVADVQLEGLSLRPLEVDTGTAKFDLTLALGATDEGLGGTLEYSTDLFDHERIVRLALHLQVLLEAAVARPELRLSRLPLMTGVEQRRLLVEWNATDRPDAEACLHELFEARAAHTPEATALLFAGGAWSYAELNRRANRLARRLRALGVGPDARVGLCATRRPELIAAILAVLKAGGAYLPIDPAYPRERQTFMLDDSGASVLLAEPELLVALASGARRALDLADACVHEDPANLDGARAPRHLAYVVYTSGSTGRPKGVGLEHAGAVNLARDARRQFDLGPGDVVLQFASFGFDASVWEWITALTSGAALLLPQREEILDPEAFTRLAASHAVSMALLPPPYLAQLDPERLAGLRTLVVGGEACPVALARRWAHGRRLFNAYGPTEASVYVTLHRCDGLPADTLPIGRPIGNVRTYVLDAHGQPLPVGVPGELHAGGAGLARGYLGRPDLTAERFVPDPFGVEPGSRLYRTGDLARYLPDGSLEFLGRIDHQVKVRGFRIELGEIEAALCEHAQVAAAAVVVREDAPGDKRLVAYVVPRESQAPSAGELRDFLERRLPEYMLPAAFVVLPALPLTPHGKVDRRALPAPDAGGGASIDDEVPRTPLEASLAALWAEVLGRERVGLRQDFFTLGGHSLLVPRLFARIEQVLGRSLPLVTLYRCPTVETLAQAFAADVSAPPSLLVPFDSEGTGPVFFCVHAAGGGVSVYKDLARHLAPDVRLHAVEAVGHTGGGELLRSVEAMARRYVEAIRQVQPQGPYHLGGWSFGGLVAFDMALQLTEAGEQVATLALIDTLPAGALSRPVGDARITMALFARLAGVPMTEDELHALTLEQALAHVSETVARATTAMGAAEEVAGRLRRVIEVAEIALDAAYQYRPRPYAGEVVLLKAAEVPPEVEALAARDPSYGWGAVARGRLVVEPVPGDHETVVREPNVGALARALRRLVTRTAVEGSAVGHTE